MTPDADWPAYYAATAERPPWETTQRAAALFADEGLPRRLRQAIDLGCGAGRDTRFLVEHGWSVLALDREPSAIAALLSRTPDRLRRRLETRVDDIATAQLPRSRLVIANVSLPFLPPAAYRATWDRILSALEPAGRIAAMLFGDRDEFASDPTMTCLAPSTVQSDLARFTIEFWNEREEDRLTALGEPHHYHIIELVAKRLPA